MRSNALSSLQRSWMLMLLAVGLACIASTARGQSPFAHPGGLHSIEDLERMKTHVQAGDSPWIESWNALIGNSLAQSNYGPHARENLGSSRQQAARDATAAYYNFIRGYISGDIQYTQHAIDICNAWSATVNQIPTGNDNGLFGFSYYQFALVGEMLRIYIDGTVPLEGLENWDQAHFDRFKDMCRNYFYPQAHDFITNHNGACVTYYWANWDWGNMMAILSMGILLDDMEMYTEAIDYFHNGEGNGGINQSIVKRYFIEGDTEHPYGLAQWQETGRDQEHNNIGVGLYAAFCQILWNQGEDYFSYDNNLLLAAAEYLGKFTMWEDVPYDTHPENCNIYGKPDVNNYWPANSQRGRLQRPIWELIYNHYVVRKGLPAPYVTELARLNRPEGYAHEDHIGFGSLLFTLDGTQSPMTTTLDAPSGVAAKPEPSTIALSWDRVPGANGYRVSVSETPGGPYVVFDSWRNTKTNTSYAGTPGTPYYFVVEALYSAGDVNNPLVASAPSVEVSATPLDLPWTTTLPTNWSNRDVGEVGTRGSATYRDWNNNSFYVEGSGSIGGTADGLNFTFVAIEGDTSIKASLTGVVYSPAGNNRRLGIMIRESLDPEAKAAALVFGQAPGFRMSVFGYRDTTGGAMDTSIFGNGYINTGDTPYFRIDRVGDVFTAYQSKTAEDGTWWEVGSVTIPMNDTVLVGLAAASDSSSALGLYTDNVSVTGVQKLPPPSGLFTYNGHNKVTLGWNAVEGAQSYNLYRTLTSVEGYEPIATGLTAASYEDTGLTDGVAYYYIVTAVDASGEETLASEEASGLPGDISTIWNPDAATGNWSEGANWIGGIAPESGSKITFSGSSIAALNNDFAGHSIAGLVFNPGAPSYTIAGNDATLSGDIINKGDSQTLSLNLVLDGSSVIETQNGTVTLSGVLSGTGGLEKAGGQTLELSGANTFSGDFLLSSGTVTIAGAGTEAAGPLGAGIVRLAGGGLTSSENSVVYNDIVVEAGATNDLSTGAGITLAGKLSGSGTINESGDNYSGTHLKGDNSGFTGVFNSSSGSRHRLRFDSPDAGSAAATWNLNNNATDGNSFNFGTGTISFGALSGGGQFRSNATGTTTVRIGDLGTDSSFWGKFVSNGSRVIAVEKVGAGRLTFSGSNSYDGATTVNGGTLIVNGPLNNRVTVNADATFGGTGSVTASIDVNAGATFAPGDAGIGTFNTTGELALQSGATFAVELDSSVGAADKVAASGVALGNATLTLVDVAPGALPEGAILTLVDNTGAEAVDGTFDGLPEASVVNVGANAYRLSYYGGDGNDVVLYDERTSPALITSPSAATGDFGEPFSYAITAANGPMSFDAAGLPAGLSVDTATGLISGAPEEYGEFAVTLSATNGFGSGTAVLELTVLVDPPSAPTSLAASPSSNTGIDLTWSAASLATAYEVKRSESATGPFETFATELVETSYTDTGLEWETTYYYTVAAVNLGGSSADSNVASATTLPPEAPPAPRNIVAVAGDGRVTVSWNASLDATDYELKRSTTPGGPYEEVATIAGTYHTDLGLANGTTYYYVVSASNYVGTSPDSKEVSATPASGALGYWPFNESDGNTTADVWNGADGSLASSASFGPGMIGNALHLDGSGDAYVTLPENLVSSLTDFTISAWVRPDAAANWARVFDFGTGTNNYMFLAPRSGRSGNGVRYAIRTASVSELALDGPALQTGKWVHLAVTQSGTTGVLYVDGVEVARNTGMSLNPSSLGSTNQNWIGKSQWPDPVFNGVIDDFRIYNHALGSGELASMLDAVRPEAPQDLVAVGEPGAVALSWTASPDAESYVVKRATSVDGPYEVIASEIVGTSYVDSMAEFGSRFYVVTAVARSVESVPSEVAEILLPPATPSQPLVGTANGQVDLLWEAPVGAIGYDILRSATSGGPYESVASISGNYYSDSGLVNGETYYYAVVATNAAGSSLPSEEVIASPSEVVVPMSLDIGGPALAGSVVQDGGAYTIEGAGTDIWGSWDRFHYCLQGFKGDVTVTARILSMSGTDGSAKAGVMIRSGLEGSSSHVSTLAGPTDGRIRQMWRSRDSGGTSAVSLPGYPMPRWIRVMRKGDTFTCYHSADGVVWTQIGSARTVAMGEEVFVGMAVNSSDRNELLSAVFDNFSATGPLPDAPSGVTATTDAGVTTVSWNEVEGATSYAVLRATSPDGPFEPVGEGIDGTSFQTPAELGDVPYYYTVIASDGAAAGFSGVPDLNARGVKLDGSAIGTSGSWGNNPATRKEAALDGNLGTFFDGPISASWVGLDLGEGNGAAVTKIRFAPRSGYASRMMGGAFQGSNDPSFAEATTLFTVTTEPAEGILTSLPIASSESFRYLRYVSLAGGSGNVAEIEFYGVPAKAPVITSPDSAAGLIGEPFAYQVTATNYAYAFEASGLPAGLSIDPLTGEIDGTLEQAGSFSVLLAASNDFGSTESVLSLSIAKVPATVALDGLAQYYDGTSRIPSVTTDPEGLAVELLYDGNATAPVFPGAYAVEAMIDDPNYEGSATGVLVVRSTALTRHAPTLNADLDGSIQVLEGESFALNSGAMISSDLLLPGTPTLQINGDPAFVDTLEGPGEAEPVGYYVTLNSGSVLRYLVTRVDPIGMPVVEAPPAPQGTRYVSVNNAHGEVGDFATLRSLTLNGNAGTVAVPPGIYDRLTVNGNGVLVLGEANATEPAGYNLQGLTLNGNARLELLGPVTITLAYGVSINGDINVGGDPDWLTLRVASGGLTVNGSGAVDGHLVVPNGTVTINSSVVNGTVVSDRLVLNGNAELIEPTP